MNRRGYSISYILWIAVLLAALAAAPAQTQKRYPLRHLITVGDRSLTESSSDTSLKLTARSGDQEAPPIEATTRYEEKYVEEVLAARGSATTRLRQQDLAVRTISTDPQGHQLVEPSSLQGKTVTIERKGDRIVVGPPGAKISPEDRTRLSRALKQTRIPLLPNRAAAIGEAWTVTTEQVKIFFPQVRTGTMKARFQEVTPYADRECAHIRLTGDLELDIAGLPAPVRAQLTGDMYHALGIQRPVAVELAGPLVVKGEQEQGGRRISLNGEGRMQVKVSIQWQKLGGRPVPAPKASRQSTAPPEAPAPPETLRYGEISVQLPAPGWKVLRYHQEARRLELGLPGEGRIRGVSIWPVEVAAAERNRSHQEHAAAYFAAERQMERPDGPWTDFQEGERPIGGRRHPTMSFQFHPNVSAEHIMDGLFLVYFPEDFEQRHRFYVLMWSDLHLKSAKPHSLEELDAVLRSLQVM